MQLAQQQLDFLSRTDKVRFLVCADAAVCKVITC